MSKRQDPNSPVAIVVWVNSESEIELVQQRDVCVHGPLGEAGKVVCPGHSSEGVRRQALGSGRFGWEI